jgi:Domain of unknown function (DUF4276)
MIRLNILTEGQTEEAFVNEVLSPYLAAFGIAACARCVTTRRDRRRPDIVHRGGLRDYAKVRRDLVRWMHEDRTAAFTTMFDLYALPDDFPSFNVAKQSRDPYARIDTLENAMYADIGDHRLVPYLQLHEFEALLFADPTKFDWEYLEHEKQIAQLVAIAGSFENPELIDDGYDTAPSKRIIAQIHEYAFQKASVGPLIAQQIGIERMRERCPHFAAWLEKLENL